MTKVGLSDEELQATIARRMAQMDEAQEEEEHLGQYGDLMRMVAMIAYQRAADLITANNRRIEGQLATAGIFLDAISTDEERT